MQRGDGVAAGALRAGAARVLAAMLAVVLAVGLAGGVFGAGAALAVTDGAGPEAATAAPDIPVPAVPAPPPAARPETATRSDSGEGGGQPAVRPGAQPAATAAAPPPPQRPAVSALPPPGAVVVELFTSQGCASCPPADALFAQLAARQDVIALALHVDYWDYIGWADSFARPEHTARQQAYARIGGRQTLFTPQIVVGGQHAIEGFRGMQVMDLIARHRSSPSRATIELSLDEAGELAIQLRAFPPLQNHVDVALVRYRPSATVTILRGENAGRVATYHNIVTAWDIIGTWDGQIDRRITHPVEGTEAVVVLLQSPGQGAILGAARLR